MKTLHILRFWANIRVRPCILCLSFFILHSSFFTLCEAQNIGINTTGTSADPSALLDVKSTTAGVLIPRMTTAQRNAISSPATGLQVYNTDCEELNYWNGTCWLSLSNNLPNPGAVTSAPSSTNVCAGASVTYSIAAVTGATSYLWTVPGGATINSGQGSTTISVTFGSNSGNVCVSAADACETSGQSCLPVSVISPIVASTGSNLQYYSSSCSAVTIGGSPTASGGTGTYAYSWNPATGLSSAIIANPAANPSSTTTYTVTVSSGGCSATSSMTFSVASGGSQTFTYTGVPQTWVVPAGVSCISITATGASGGTGYVNGGSSGTGGPGGTVSGIKLVTPGSVLTINIGQQGGNASSASSGVGGINGGGNGGYNSSSQSGGGGGGASDVMLGGTSLSNRIIIAGGGGGGAPNNSASTGGTGGYPYGGNGFYQGSFNSSYCGDGGTVFSGGGGAGLTGGLGYGGNGSGCGGGGGGGYYGGGGGGSCYAGGGGGGASYIGGMSSNTSFSNGNNTGNGQVIINW